MASTNQSPEYSKAQGMYLQAKTDDERLRWLEEMIKQCPKHKSSEAMLANLKTRRKKLLVKIESGKKSGRGSGKQGIKKEDLQAVIVGFTGSGKSSLLASLTNTKPRISPYPFTTKNPMVGMMFFAGIQIQLVEVPAMESEYFDRGLANSADTLIVVISSVAELADMQKEVSRYSGHKIFVFNNKESIDERRLDSTFKSKKLNYVITNLDSEANLHDLKEKIFQSFGKIRVYTKEPGKQKSDRPIIMEQNSTVEEIAEKIFHGFSKQVRETRIWGPSSKFAGQVVGLKHQLKDLDVVEFKTR